MLRRPLKPPTNCAEQKGGEFITYDGNGDGKGVLYSGGLNESEVAPVNFTIDKPGKVPLKHVSTIEVHYVHTTEQVTPGPTLGSCLSDAIGNPQLRLEGQVFVLVNEENAADFMELMEVGMINGYYQAFNIPSDTGTPIVYAGSTTGPSYNEKGSPFQVTWSVRPEVVKVSASSVARWLAKNIFEEFKAHGVRNLVTNPKLISSISN